MNRPPFTRIVAFALTSLVALAAIVGLLLHINHATGFVGCTGMGAFGWTIPLVTGVIIAGVAWLLLNTDQQADSGYSDVSTTCAACGESVIRGWRLCPHCGSMMGPVTEASRPEDAA